MDNSRLNISGEEALVIVDGRVFHSSINLKKKLLPILLVLQKGFNNNPVGSIRCTSMDGGIRTFSEVIVRAYRG